MQKTIDYWLEEAKEALKSYNKNKPMMAPAILSAKIIYNQNHYVG